MCAGVLGTRQETHSEKALPLGELEHQLLQGRRPAKPISSRLGTACNSSLSLSPLSLSLSLPTSLSMSETPTLIYAFFSNRHRLTLSRSVHACVGAVLQHQFRRWLHTPQEQGEGSSRTHGTGRSCNSTHTSLCQPDLTATFPSSCAFLPSLSVSISS